MRKFIAIVVVALVVLCGVGFYVYKANDVNKTYENKETKEVNNNILSMMLETSAGSGEYQKTSASAWPTEGYVFNSALSKCKNGSNLSWDKDKKQVIFDGINKDECYVYFDVHVPTINEVCSNENAMSNCIKKLYTKQGENNLYLHDSSLTNGAGDNSYRYAGSSDTTNNFICFGYDSIDGTCPTDYLYRIIGVFDNHVKLIKYDYAKTTLLGTDGDYLNTYYGAGYNGTNKGNNLTTEIGVYYWNNNTQTNIWSASRLNTVNLNTNYLKNIGTNWSNKIAAHTWKVGGNTFDNIASVIASNTYKNEITSPVENTLYDAKIGLMYVSDYGYAAAPSVWTTTLDSYSNSSVTSVNWMYMGLAEWTILPQSENSSHVFTIGDSGHVSDFCSVDYVNAIRLTFYLNANVSYINGSGTKENPILIN